MGGGGETLKKKKKRKKKKKGKRRKKKKIRKKNYSKYCSESLGNCSNLFDLSQMTVRRPEYLVVGALGSLSCLMQCRWFHPPLRRIFPVEGTFTLGVNMGSDSIPPKLF